MSISYLLQPSFKENNKNNKKTIVVNEIGRNKKQARGERACDGCARTSPQSQEVHFFLFMSDLKQSEVTVLFYSNLQIV